jgi:PBP1b-binding outer membrane lipoprotein LpoB
MKKILISLAFLALFFFGSSEPVHAIGIESLTTSIDKTTSKKGSTANQISFLKTLQTLLQSPNFKNSEYSQIFAELEKHIGEKI